MFGNKKSSDIHSNSNNVIDTLIGENCKIKGDVVCDHSIKIEGQVLGNVLSKSTVIIGKDAVVKGDVNSDILVVYGKIDGNVQSDSLDLKETSILQGDIATRVFQCEAGSVYKGTIEMEDNDVLEKEDKIEEHFDQIGLPNK